jgi:hypothetical protein
VVTDNAMVYRSSRRFAAVLADRGPPHPDPALHATLEREGGEVHPDPVATVGPRPPVAEFDRAPSLTAILPALLQPTSTAQLPG